MKLSILVLAGLFQSSTAFSVHPSPLNINRLNPSTTSVFGSENTDGDDTTSSEQRRSLLQKSLATGFSVLVGAPAFSYAEAPVVGGKIKFGDDSIMSQKEHGTSSAPVQEDLLYGVSRKLSDRICNYNRHFAEMGGYFQSTSFTNTVLEAAKEGKPLTFYDSVTGKPLFVAPLGRSAEDFIKESEVHGWPSFRDQEVVWDNVRVLRSSGETVSVDGTHLGHNLPDRSGNRYCINLVSVAGRAA